MTGPEAAHRAARYLLGELPEAEREAFEDEYFGDEEAYGELLAAEDELIDRYCEGALSSEQQRRFEERYLTTADGRERVEFARALKRAAGARQPRPAKLVQRERVPRTAWVAALAAALLAVGLPVAWQRGAVRRAHEERTALREQIARQQAQAGEQDRRLAELGERLAQLQQQARALDELLGAGKALRAASLALKGGLRREAAALPRLILPPETPLVRLQLQLDGPPRAAYRASLQTPEGRELWARDGLPPASADGKPVVSFTVPAAVLSPGHYVVVLGPAGGRGESDAEFVFEVRRTR